MLFLYSAPWVVRCNVALLSGSCKFGDDCSAHVSKSTIVVERVTHALSIWWSIELNAVGVRLGLRIAAGTIGVLWRLATRPWLWWSTHGALTLAGGVGDTVCARWAVEPGGAGVW